MEFAVFLFIFGIAMGLACAGIVIYNYLRRPNGRWYRNQGGRN